MTTIAYRDGVIAADTQATENGVFVHVVTKVLKRGPVLACASGGDVWCRNFMDWIRRGCDPGELPDMGDGDKKDRWADGHIILPDETFVRFQPFGIVTFRAPDGIWADGAGMEVAIGAMMAGASAEEAVRCAIRRDNVTGGEVTVLRRC